MNEKIKKGKSVDGREVIARNKNIYEGIDASDFTMEIKDSTDEGDNGSEISYHFRMKSAAGTIAFDNKATVIKEDGEYRIVWDSSQIFPQLQDADKVNVSITEGTRGSILDRKGKALAQQGSVYQVGLIAGKLGNEADAVSGRRQGSFAGRYTESGKKGEGKRCFGEIQCLSRHVPCVSTGDGNAAGKQRGLERDQDLFQNDFRTKKRY